uniref:Copia protein n=1 Tax=Tanacetum cinerariifolium TaxID=118510 RepID=A0A6L2LBN4_TANCI|nr:copia protein [Tanacetum cinerariifolium]
MNKKDERGIVVRNKARLVAQGHRQEERISYDEVFTLVARIEAIRIFLASASFMGFIVYQMDVKSAFLYDTIKEEVKQSEEGMFVSQDKYVAEILKKFDFSSVKTTSTQLQTQKPLLKDEVAADVDVHLYKSMIGSLMYLINFRPDIMFAVCACSRFQCKKQTKVVTSTTEAKYVAASQCCGQVLWIQNQLLDYGFNLLNSKIYIDNESTICIVKNPVYHLKAKHIEIRHHFIRDSYEKKLIQYCWMKLSTASKIVDAAVLKTCSSINLHMADLKFVDQHNMVACLEKTKENAEFHQIVDFLSTCSINYALTAVVISESSVRSDLLFNDEDGIACLTNAKNFENLALMGYEQISTKLTFQKGSFSPQWKFLIHTILHCLSSKSTAWNEFSINLASAAICLAKGQSFNFSKLIFDGMLRNLDSKKFLMYPRKVTLLFDSMLVQNQAHEGEGLAIPTEPQPIPSTSQPNISATQTAPLQTATHPTEIGSGDRPRRQATTLGGADAQTWFVIASKRSSDLPLSTGHTVGSEEDRMEQETNLTDFVPPTPYDSPFSRGHTLGSDEGRPNIDELMNLCTQLSNRVLALEQFKTAQDLVIKRLRKKVQKIRKEGRVESNRIEELNLSDKGNGETKVFNFITATEKDVNAAEPVSTAGDVVNAASVIPNVSTAGPSTSTVEDIFKDKMTTMADTLMAIRRTRPRTTSVVIHDVEEEPRRATPQPIVQSQDKDLIAERKRFFTAQRAKQIRNKPPTEAQLRNKMVTYLKHMGKYTHNQLKSKSFKEIQMLYEREQKWINDFVPMDSKEKLKEDDAKKEELRACLDIVSLDDIAIDVESLATKYPIVNWKTHTLTEHVMYYQIIRANGSSKNYKILTEMCDDFDRQDIMDLYRQVNERYESTSPKGYDLFLWGDLITLFELSEEDVIWKAQQDYRLISWRLFDSCGVLVLLMDTRIDIHKLVERKYPLIQEMLSRMLNRRL